MLVKGMLSTVVIFRPTATMFGSLTVTLNVPKADVDRMLETLTLTG